MKDKTLHSSVDEQEPPSRTSVRAPSTPSVSTHASHRDPAQESMCHPDQNSHVDCPAGNGDAINQPEDWVVTAGLLAASGSAGIVRSIYKATDGNGPSRSDIHTPSIAPDHMSDRTGATNPPRTSSSRSEEYVLPSRKVADKLLDIHWSCSHVPWVDQLRLETWYDRLWTGHDDEADEVDEQVYHLILNTIFALGSRMDSPERPEGQARLSEQFFDRAKSLMNFNLFDVNRIGLVQGLLLVSQYLQSANMTRQCSEAVGLAITIGQNLRLHMPQRLASIKSQYDREMACRAWHCCILMDRITSMTHGRPMRISQEVARRSPLPAAIDDEHLEDGEFDRMQPPDQPSKLAFFLAFCKLHIILGDILTALYYERAPSEDQVHAVDNSANVETQHDIVKTMEFDQALSNWREDLDIHLQIGPDGTVADSKFQGQAVNLFARYLHVRVLLFRTFLSRLLTKMDRRTTSDYPGFSREPSQFADTVTCSGLITGVKTAQQMLELLSSNNINSSRPGVAPPWYIVISYVYTAATLVIAARLIPHIVENVTLASLTRSTTQSLELLKLLEFYGSSQKPAQQCKAALTILYDKILAIENASDGSPSCLPSFPEGTSNDNDENNDITLPYGLHWDVNLPETLFDEDFHWHFDNVWFDTNNTSQL